MKNKEFDNILSIVKEELHHNNEILSELVGIIEKLTEENEKLKKQLLDFSQNS